MTARPNIVLILVDDLGWRDLGCFGSTFYETPNIDRLATDGTSFVNSYAAAPVCSPTRASLLSGKYPARVGVTNFIGGHAVGRLADVPYFHGLPRNEYSLARALRAGGYRTWHVGKWHLGSRLTSPEQHGFDRNIGGTERGAPTSYFTPYDIATLPDGPPGEYLTDRLTDEAVRLIEQSDDQPFFLNLWHYTVHIPLQAPEQLIEKYRQKAQSLGLDQEPIEVGEPMPTWHKRGQRVERRTLQSNPTYAAMIESLDIGVGRVVDALEASGKLDQTMIIFTSDNGGLATAEGSPTCNSPLGEGKGWMADGGIRVPTIVRLPDQVPAGRRSELVMTTPDFYPTLLSAAGLDRLPDQHVDGIDLWARWRGDPAARGPIFWHYPHYSNQGGTPAASVRDGRWKLIRFFEDDHEELYDLDGDVSERTDRAADQPDTVTRLSGLLDDWLDEVGARIPATNPAGPEPWPDPPGAE
ncbi:MAG TPA: sulfatase [Microlunatus sp.]